MGRRQAVLEVVLLSKERVEPFQFLPQVARPLHCHLHQFQGLRQVLDEFVACRRRDNGGRANREIRRRFLGGGAGGHLVAFCLPAFLVLNTLALTAQHHTRDPSVSGVGFKAAVMVKVHGSQNMVQKTE